MIRFLNYSKRYESRLVLHVPEMELNAGVYWLKGENGSGKTTFLKSIAGLIPFEGTIELQGISIKQEPMNYRRLVSYAEAEPLYPAFLTGDDLIKFYLQTRQAEPEQVNYLADMFGTSSYRNQKVGAYSSGMAKKLSLLLAFLGKPKLILLDEPFITLDQKSLQVLPELISNYSQQGTSFIISSHQAFDTLQPVALTVSDQTISLQQPVC